MKTQIALATLCLLTTPCLAAAPAMTPAAMVRHHAETVEQAEQRASSIRNDSVADWREGNYAEAARKLEEAVQIYEGLPGEYLSERAISLRAVCWNQINAGDMPAAWSAFEHLSKMRSKGKVTDGLKAELASAIDAMVAGASDLDDAKAGVDWLEKCYGRARALGLDDLRAKIRQEQGSLASRTTMKRRSVTKLFDEALQLYTASGDTAGAAWTRLAMGRFLIERGKLDDAGELMLQLYKQVLEDGLFEAQSAAANGVELFFKSALESEETKRSTANLAWKLAAVGDETNAPRILTRDRVEWLAAQVDAKRRGRKAATEAAEKLHSASSMGLPAVVLAERTLNAAELAAQDDPGLALEWLAGIKLPDAPARAQLEARRALLEAVASAAAKDTSAFDAAAARAMELYAKLDYLFLEVPAIDSLFQAGAKLEGSTQEPLVEARRNELRRTGRPGGRGGSVLSKDISEKIADLGLEDPVFELRVDEDGILITDLLGGAEAHTDTSLQPHNLTFNGLALRVQGGYVSILSMNYGDSSGARGGRGEGDLDLAVPFHALSAKGALVVAKNGAISYR